MTSRNDLIAALWNGADPFRETPVKLYAPDPQGWNSQHPFLTEAIDEARPKVVVEIGVWKGGSVMTMADRARHLDLDCAVIAIDTWLGSVEHWISEDWRKDLRSIGGYPNLFHTFMANVMSRELQDFVVPIPLDSANAFELLKHNNIMVDVLHIDAGHDYRSVENDLAMWWSILKPGGVFIGDDYFTDGVTWQEVKMAIDDFASRTPHERFRHADGKCTAIKV